MHRFLKYCVVGSTGVVVNMTTLYFFTSVIGLHYMVSNFIGISAAVLSNFILNDQWTWRSEK